jgi:hypothetical protein
VAIVEEYEGIFILMILKFYHHLYPLCEVESSFVGESDKTCQLDIFEMIAKKVQAKKKYIQFLYLVAPKKNKLKVDFK